MNLKLKSTHDFSFRNLNKKGEFVPATDIINIFPNFLEIIYTATQIQDNILFNKMYSSIYDEQREIHFYLEKIQKEHDYDMYNDETYLYEYPMRLKLSRYQLLNERYINLNPNIKSEENLSKSLKLSSIEILKIRDINKIESDMMDEILNEILKNENE